MSIYIRKDRHIKVKAKGKGDRALVRDNTAVAYLPPHFNHHEVTRKNG